MNDSMQRQARRAGNLLSLWIATSQKDNFSVDDTTWRKFKLSKQHGTYQEFMERSRSQRVGKEHAVKKLSSELNELTTANLKVQQQIISSMMRSDSVLGRGKNDDIDGAMATHKDERNGTIEDLREQHTRLQQELRKCEREARIAEADLATYSDTHDLPDHTVWLLCVRKRDEVTKARWKESFEKRSQTSGTINDATVSNTSSA